MPRAKRSASPKKSRISGIPAPYADRIARFRAALAEHRIDGFLVVDRMDQIWLTGFTGEDGGVLVTANSVVLLTDGRFITTAAHEAPWARTVIRVVRGPEATAKELKREKITKLGFEPLHMNVAVFSSLAKLARPAKLIATSGLISGMRQSKTPSEVAAVRKAIAIAEQAFREMSDWLRPGLTEREVAARLVFEMQKLGAQAASFAPIVAVGPNGALPHYEAGDAVVRRDQGLLIDWGARADWYVSDLTRMVWLGSIPPKLKPVLRAVRAAHDAAIEAVRPGVRAEDVDRVARSIIRKAGFDKQFNHGLGHGIGLNVHEAPRLARRSQDVLRPGMIVTIEPGVYLPGVGGVRLEDDVLVTETGYEVLSTLPC